MALLKQSTLDSMVASYNGDLIEVFKSHMPAIEQDLGPIPHHLKAGPSAINWQNFFTYVIPAVQQFIQALIASGAFTATVPPTTVTGP